MIAQSRPHMTEADLRFIRRPMLGIDGFEPLDPTEADRLGVPVQDGLRIHGVIPGMGAAAAGLQAEDVIVAIDGNPITSPDDLIKVMATYYAGDVIPVTFYRRHVRQMITLQLSGRPIPTMPETPEGLAEYLRAGYQEVQHGLAALFEKMTESQAGHCPMPDQWSARETLAHLVLAERDRQTFIGGLLRGDGDHLDLRANLTPRVEALVERAGSVPKLLTELGEAQAETVALVARLPTEFAAEGVSFWMFAHYHVPNMVEHGRVHAAQIRDVIRQMDDRT